MIDYGTALLLIVVPLFFLLGGPGEDVPTGGGSDGSVAIWVLVASGALLLGLSLLTRYELGVFETIPMQAHLYIDMGLGAFLIVSPWLLGFADVVRWPHVVVGALEVGIAAMTQRRSPVETPGSAAATAH
jgi:hypothetical protein